MRDRSRHIHKSQGINNFKRGNFSDGSARGRFGTKIFACLGVIGNILGIEGRSSFGRIVGVVRLFADTHGVQGFLRKPGAGNLFAVPANRRGAHPEPGHDVGPQRRLGVVEEERAIFVSQQRKWELIRKSRGVLRGMTPIAAIEAMIFLALRIADADLQQKFRRGDFDFEIFAAAGPRIESRHCGGLASRRCMGRVGIIFMALNYKR